MGFPTQPIVVDGDSSAGGDGIPGNLTGEGNQELIDVGIHQLDVQPGSSHDVGASAHLPISSKKRKTCPRHVETGKDMVKCKGAGPKLNGLFACGPLTLPTAT